MESLRQVLESVGQEQLLSFYDELSDSEKMQLVYDLKDIDWEDLDKIYKEQVLPQLDSSGTQLRPVAKIDDTLLKELPDTCVSGTTQCEPEQLEFYRTLGLEHIKTSKVAVLLLAGGQGTRLGSDLPKGMYDVGIPGNKSLFQLQAERIQSLKNLTCATQILWYIMTSAATMSKTREFFEEKNFFGLNKDDVIFFEQGTMPCFSFDGKVLLDNKFKLSKSPDGNGGLYEALHKHGILENMVKNGVDYVHVYCVDNILVRVCDPVFMGYCINKSVDAGAKVVEKVRPDEAVGIICKVGEKFKVIEYSEISDTIAGRRNESTGKLIFNAGNICDHFFRVSFLNTIKGNSKRLRYHLAVKKVPHVDMSTGERVAKPQDPCGIKLEKFIFDVFEFTQHFAAWQVKREDEFSPLKNADGTNGNNPTTAREALLRAAKLGLLCL